VHGSRWTSRRVLPLLALGFLLGAGAGYYVGSGRLAGRGQEGPEGRGQEGPESQDLQIRGNREGFTNPLLDCEVAKYTLGRELRPFRGQIADLVRRLEREPGLKDIAVYFRDLDNGPWFGIGERKNFTPGSLYKVPVIMAALKQAELVPGYFDQRVLFPGLPDPRLGLSQFGQGEGLVAGREYAIEELLHLVAAHSDNAATWLLRQTIREELLARTLSDMGFDPVRMEFGGRTLTAKSYGRFFRILYNASYLSRPMSEFALSLFAEATFKDGLVAGVPPGTVVAHKFGERGEQGKDGQMHLQLHDCGIVYHPGRPYLICVMTEGSDYGAMAGAISGISREVYTAVASQSGLFPGPVAFP
jgi:beta-lactamase class A